VDESGRPAGATERPTGGTPDAASSTKPSLSRADLDALRVLCAASWHSGGSASVLPEDSAAAHTLHRLGIDYPETDQ
jgi:hypothetical protein